MAKALSYLSCFEHSTTNSCKMAKGLHLVLAACLLTGNMSQKQARHCAISFNGDTHFQGLSFPSWISHSSVWKLKSRTIQKGSKKCGRAETLSTRFSPSCRVSTLTIAPSNMSGILNSQKTQCLTSPTSRKLTSIPCFPTGLPYCTCITWHSTEPFSSLTSFSRGEAY